MKIALVLIFLTLFDSAVFSQSFNQNDIVEKIEFLIQQNDNLPEGIDYNELVNYFTYYAKHPININTASSEELSKVGINLFLFNNLQRHIKSYGKLIEKEELQLVVGFNRVFIEAITPFVSFSGGEIIKTKSLLHPTYHTLSIGYKNVIQEQKGFSNGNNSFKGLSFGTQLRYRYQLNQSLKIGITLENDEGEQYTTPDYYTGYINFKRKKGLLRQVLFGDFQIKDAQGLIIWTGLGFSKTPNVLDVSKSSSTLFTYGSINESNFLRGAAIGLKTGEINHIVAYSNKMIDANLAIIDNKRIYGSRQIIGLHRTPSEIQSKNAFNEQLFFFKSEYQKDNLTLGVSVTHSSANAFYRPITSINNLFKPNDGNISKYGTHYNYNFKNIYLFGQVAQSFPNNGFGIIQGAIANLSRDLGVSVLYRNYLPEYQYEKSLAFSESSQTVNESGLYLGFNYAFINSRLNLSAYVDWFNSNWSRFNVLGPSYGNEYFCKLGYQPHKRFAVFFSTKWQNKQENINNEKLPTLTMNQTIKHLFYYSYKASSDWTFRGRIGVTNFINYKDNELGFLTAQDIIYKPLRKKLGSIFRYALFSTPSYNSRVYAFENDILNKFNIPSYSGEGVRFNIILYYKMMKSLKLSLQLTNQYFFNRQTVGSGLGEIQGPRMTTFKAVMKWSI